jgi:predicted nicotinamide N-methyase
MPGYQTKMETVAIAGVADLVIRSLLDRRQYHDPLGEAALLGISTAAWPLFGLLWPSGAELAARLAARRVRPGERILEIGCGLGLASLAGHRCGADVTASDCHPLASSFLQANLQLNGLQPMKYRHGAWADRPAAATPLRPANVCGDYDLIIGSDVLYDRDASLALAGFIDRHSDATTLAWIVDPDRGNRAAFTRAMAGAGFAMKDERLDRVARGRHAAFRGRLLSFHRPP